MRTNSTYHSKIKLLIILLAVISQAFLFATVTASYISSKVSSFNSLTEHQNIFYRDELDTLAVKIDNLFYLLENSGALKFCSGNTVFAPSDKTTEKFSKIKTTLGSSVFADRYFSGYYILGKNINQVSFRYLEGNFSEPGEIKIHHENLINNYAVNSFTKNYQKLFVFNKTDFADIKVDHETSSDYIDMLEQLDGRIVYFSVQQDVMCIFIINSGFLDAAFADADITNTSAVIYNKENEAIYSTGTALTSSQQKYDSEMYSLVTSSELTLTPTDIIFILCILICCTVIVLWAVHISKVYADRIIEPYRIFKGIFGLNNMSDNLEEINYSEFSPKKRSHISRNIFKALILAIIIPTAVSSVAYVTALNFTSDYFIRNSASCAHSHLVQRLYDTFDFYITSTGIYDSAAETTSISRLKYSVTLDENFSLDSQPFEKLNYISSSAFNKQLKEIKKTSSVNGTLMYIDSDLFGDHALASIHKTDDDTYKLTVFKYETIGSIVPDSNTNFMLLDSGNNIVTQNLYISEAEKFKIINGSRGKLIYKTDFEEFGWTLYSFSNISNIKSRIYAVICLDITAILVFMLLIIIFSWVYSTRFMVPLERIKTAMAEGNESVSVTEANEIEDVLNVYNRMVRHIQKITEDKIDLVREEERVNALKIKAELNALQQQINPHFLYNTLEMINLSVLKLGDFSTSKVIGKLSQIFRYAISTVDEIVCLADEIENTKNYMSIWDMRFPGRYTFNWELDESILNTKTLKLILQPVIENCFFHAFDNIMSGCAITVSACMRDDYIAITIQDNGIGMSNDSINSLYEKLTSDTFVFGKKGIGISNVYKRLKLYYEANADIVIESQPNNGTQVEIKFIPE